jgi:hypothetical protein
MQFFELAFFLHIKYNFLRFILFGVYLVWRELLKFQALLIQNKNFKNKVTNLFYNIDDCKKSLKLLSKILGIK